MAESESIIARAISRIWPGPNKSAIIEDETEQAPAEGELVSRSGESFTIPAAWLKVIIANDDAILARGGGIGLKLYEELLDDDVAFSNFQQRRLAVISKEWEVAPGDEDDPRSVAAADHLRGQLKRLSFDRICDKMLYATWFGYAVGEGLYGRDKELKIVLDDIVVPDRRWFGFTGEGELRFRPGFSLSGEQLPANKFWVIRTGGSHDFCFYGIGLAHWCYWPIWFKRNVIKFWALYLEKLGYPTVVGEIKDTWTDKEKDEYLATLVAIGKDRAVRLPQDAIAGLKLMESTRSGSGTSSYLEFVTEQNEALMRVILGQPGSSKATANGLGSGQAEAHADVKEEIVKADADLLCESFNQSFAVWLTRWNFGDDVEPPRVYRVIEEAEDVEKTAERDVKLDGIGIRRTADSVEEIYGPGYELVERPTPAEEAQAKADLAREQLASRAGLPAPGPAANDDEQAKAKREKQRQEFAAEDVAPLYVYRSLKNTGPVLKWARSVGIPNLVPANELHVTVINSKTPVDWFELSDGWAYNSEIVVAEGGARKIKRFEDGAIVLQFGCDDLKWSHERKIARGASHDFNEYKIHVTLGFDPNGDFDVDEIETAYTGELKFGPEMFEKVRPWLPPGIREIEFTAGDEDIIERLASSLADEASPLFLEFGATIKKALEGVSSPEAARVALLEAFESMPAEQMAQISGLPFTLARMTAEAGIEP